MSMIRFLLGVVVGVAAARAMQQRQGRVRAAPQTVGHVDELSTAADRAGVAAVNVNAGDGTGGSRPDLEADLVAPDGLAPRRSSPHGGTDLFAGSKKRGESDGETGSETFNGA
jgi:hypothetical protein